MANDREALLIPQENPKPLVTGLTIRNTTVT